jgi:hypothetical protein
VQQIKILLETSAGTVEELDPPSGEAIKLNYSIASTEKPGKRTGGFSREVKLPPTRNNIRVLGFLHEINDFDSKDVTNRKTCYISNNGTTYMRGFARVDAIKRGRNLNYFRLRVFADNADVKDQLDKVYLNDLDYGEIKNDVATLEATWAYTDSDDGDYLFPLVNYGKWRGVTSQLDYVTPGDLAPALFVRPLVHKCFNAIGYNVSSTFLDGAICKRLLLPYTHPSGYVHGDAWRNGMEFKASNTSSQVVSTFGYTQIQFPTEEFDNGSDFASHTFTAPKDGHWSFTFKATVTSGSTTLSVGNDIVFRKNGTPLTSVYSMPPNFGPNAVEFRSGWVKLTQGDTIDMAVLQLTGGVTLAADYTLENTTRPEIQTDDDVNIEGTLRPDISQWKYIEGLVGMFNLMVLTDAQSKTVYIEPRDTFYNSITDAWDITSKVDISSVEDTIINTPNRELTFTYKPDSNDKFVKARNEAVGANLGEYEYNMPERFKKGKQAVGTSLFAATYMIYDKRLPARTNSIGNLSNPNDARAPLVPVMWNEEVVSSDYPDQSYNFAPRILYWMGNSNEPTRLGSVPRFWWGDALLTHSVQHKYPKAVSYNLDNINTDPNLLYHDRTVDGTTTQGLYSTYFHNEINNTSKGVKRTCKVRLTDKDMLMLSHNANKSEEPDFRNLIYMKIENGQYWVLYDVKDYEPGGNKLTTCVFIRYLPNESAPAQTLGPKEVGGEIDVNWPDDVIDFSNISGVTNHFTYTDNGGIIVAVGGPDKYHIVANK